MQIEVEVNPTEDVSKVKQAVENIFGSLNLEEKLQQGGSSLLTTLTKNRESLVKFKQLLRRERIRDAARTVLLKSLDKDTISFNLNKQVAFVGHLSFCEPVAESPLGPIKVKITSDNPKKLIDWLTPRAL
ncbi:MAG: hypothetical protein JSV05_07915 [Candidatus Bathyarchaeota archaeon]|nr:MAG: hypothetical protein JSV05_07915 [Candidatus Bathyarchaeota archaeon]